MRSSIFIPCFRIFPDSKEAGKTTTSGRCGLNASAWWEAVVAVAPLAISDGCHTLSSLYLVAPKVGKWKSGKAESASPWSVTDPPANANNVQLPLPLPHPRLFHFRCGTKKCGKAAGNQQPLTAAADELSDDRGWSFVLGRRRLRGAAEWEMT